MQNEGAMSDDWRLIVDFDEEHDGTQLLERLEALRFAAEERKRLGDRVIVSRDAGRVLFYTGTGTEARSLEELLRGDLEREDKTAVVSLERWHPAERVWKDADVPLPMTEAELEAEEDRYEAREEADAEATGFGDWEVRVELASHEDTVELAERLEAEGIPVVRRHMFLLVGAATEDDAKELAKRLKGEAPAGGTVHVQPGGEMVWEVTPPNPFVMIAGGLGG
jgi:hypothetical protein